MAVTINGVAEKSRAQRVGIQPGDVLVAINGHEIIDVLDYRFFETERELRLSLRRGGESYEVELVKPQYAELGLEFETYLMDKQRSCRNKCVFCFIDQLPPGMRETLYFKDDDDRLSFLFGNYITLTNIDDREVDRILQMHISPINVSVHTMDPQLRCTMMHNRFAGDSLRHLYRLAEGGIHLNCQIVLCPGVNDGPALEHTLEEFWSLGEGLLSVACVPVGLTRYREGLYPLVPFNRQTAGEALDILERWGARWKAERGARTVYASDELYLLAGRPIPPLEFYEDFPQIENGVGMLRSLIDEVEEELALREKDESISHTISIATGYSAAPVLRQLADRVQEKYPNVYTEVYPIVNHFFGERITVAGLLTFQDLKEQLLEKNLGERLLLPSTIVKSDEDLFLDDYRVGDLETALQTPVNIVKSSGRALIEALLLETETIEHSYTDEVNKYE